jgi:hypothetical protein
VLAEPLVRRIPSCGKTKRPPGYPGGRPLYFYGPASRILALWLLPMAKGNRKPQAVINFYLFSFPSYLFVGRPGEKLSSYFADDTGNQEFVP